MNRGDWMFTYTPAEIRKGAAGKVDYHGERTLFWKGEEESAEAAVRQASVTFRIIDTTLTRRLEECRSKLKEHLSMEKEYMRWATVLQRRTGAIELSMADIIYFGLDEATP